MFIISYLSCPPSVALVVVRTPNTGGDGCGLPSQASFCRQEISITDLATPQKPRETFMKACIRLVAIFAISLAAYAPSLFAQLPIPSDGSDGALNIISNTVIDLGQAVPGVWNNSNTGTNIGKGIYDPNKWAVVFKYSSVSIASNATVTFKNHLTHAPVVWLVNGNVTINGLLSLEGQDGTFDPITVPEPGPGGFRGGARDQPSLGHSGGFGPGGYYNDHGGYADHNAYGNPQIIPLIGGSGGSGNANSWNGGGGGGAILIAASSNITLSASGQISVSGGNGPNAWDGSGGAIRLVADQILGSGRIEAGSPGAYGGRLRLEANTPSPSLSLNPPTAFVSPTPLLIWPEANAPTVKVISVAGQSAPLDPKAEISAVASDLTIANSSSVAILLQTSNFPTNGTVNVYIKRRNSSQSILPASFLSGTTNLATWQLTTTLPVNHTVIQARAVSN